MKRLGGNDLLYLPMCINLSNVPGPVPAIFGEAGCSGIGVVPVPSRRARKIGEILLAMVVTQHSLHDRCPPQTKFTRLSWRDIIQVIIQQSGFQRRIKRSCRTGVPLRFLDSLAGSNCCAFGQSYKSGSATPGTR